MNYLTHLLVTVGKRLPLLKTISIKEIHKGRPLKIQNIYVSPYSVFPILLSNVDMLKSRNSVRKMLGRGMGANKNIILKKIQCFQNYVN